MCTLRQRESAVCATARRWRLTSGNTAKHTHARTHIRHTYTHTVCRPLACSKTLVPSVGPGAWWIGSPSPCA
eukprot:1186879-Prorocentrum_minimum.AAC.2